MALPIPQPMDSNPLNLEMLFTENTDIQTRQLYLEFLHKAF
jgi:hypothetical protein